jgi:hypothetical protein
MSSKRQPKRIAELVQAIAREVRFETRVTPHEVFAVHMGPPTVPKGSSTETSALITVLRPAVQLDDNYLIAIFPGGYKAFRLESDGRWIRQPGGWGRATERSLLRITINVFHAMMWRRFKGMGDELRALDEIPWEESGGLVVGIVTSNIDASKLINKPVASLGNSNPFEAWIIGDAATRQIQQIDKRPEAADPGTEVTQEAREESSGPTPPEAEAVPPVLEKNDLPMSPLAKPLRRRLARIKRS